MDLNINFKMKTISGFLFTVSLISFFGCGGAPKDLKPIDGKVIYLENCVRCHGGDGKAGNLGAADLSTSKLEKEMTFTVIKEGKNAMTGFFATLNDDQIHAVMDYIATLKK